MNYVTIKNGVVSPIERKQLYYKTEPIINILNLTKEYFDENGTINTLYIGEIDVTPFKDNINILIDNINNNIKELTFSADVSLVNHNYVSLTGTGTYYLGPNKSYCVVLHPNSNDVDIAVSGPLDYTAVDRIENLKITPTIINYNCSYKYNKNNNNYDVYYNDKLIGNIDKLYISSNINRFTYFRSMTRNYEQPITDMELLNYKLDIKLK